MYGKSYEAKNILSKSHKRPIPKQVREFGSSNDDLFSALFAENIKEIKHKVKYDRLLSRKGSKKDNSRKPSMSIVEEDPETPELFKDGSNSVGKTCSWRPDKCSYFETLGKISKTKNQSKKMCRKNKKILSQPNLADPYLIHHLLDDSFDVITKTHKTDQPAGTHLDGRAARKPNSVHFKIPDELPKERLAVGFHSKDNRNHPIKFVPCSTPAKKGVSRNAFVELSPIMPVQANCFKKCKENKQILFKENCKENYESKPSSEELVPISLFNKLCIRPEIQESELVEESCQIIDVNNSSCIEPADSIIIISNVPVLSDEVTELSKICHKGLLSLDPFAESKSKVVEGSDISVLDVDTASLEQINELEEESVKSQDSNSEISSCIEDSNLNAVAVSKVPDDSSRDDENSNDDVFAESYGNEDCKGANLKVDENSVKNTITFRKKTCIKNCSVTEESQLEPRDKSCPSENASLALARSFRRLTSRHSHLVVPLEQWNNSMKLSTGFREAHIAFTSSLGIQTAIASVPVNESFKKGPSFKDVVLRKCGQTKILNFSDAFPIGSLDQCKKVGEGVYGEVFARQLPDMRNTVLKIIPVEGVHKINGEVQKTFEEVLSEIVITMELSNLRKGEDTCTSNFPELIRCWCVQGLYPSELLVLWDTYHEEKTSENDSPEILPEDQIYIILEMANVGTALEGYSFSSAEQALYTFKQVTYTLAVAETALEFEHRDLHWGNILMQTTKSRKYICKIAGTEYSTATGGVQASVIDFTLSRMTFEGFCIFNNLSQDPGIFEGQGDYQFDIYRMMRDHINNKWEVYEAYNNVLWLSYLLDKLVTEVYYRNKTSKVHKRGMEKLESLRGEILHYKSATEVAAILKCQ